MANLKERDRNKEIEWGWGRWRSNGECGRLEEDRDRRRQRHKELERLILGDRTVSKTERGGRKPSYTLRRAHAEGASSACLLGDHPCCL